MLQGDEVELSVFLVGPSGATLLGSSSRPMRHTDDRIVSEVVSAVRRRSADVAGKTPGHTLQDDVQDGKSPAWASAFLQALCHVKKAITQRDATPDIVERQAGQHNRILSIVSSSDGPGSSKYLPVMNGFFAAQRDKIMVDCCDLDVHGSTEALYRQGCQMTSGFYLKPSRPEALLEYLMIAFAADPPSREYLRYPATGNVDFRASCFCHSKLIDTGYVCSVCLSVFCAKTDECATCGAVFR